MEAEKRAFNKADFSKAILNYLKLTFGVIVGDNTVK